MTSSTMPIGNAPLVTWAPPQPDKHADRGRSAGAAVGCLVALAFALVTATDEPVGLSPIAVPTLVAGTIGGWLFGPSAWRARMDADWLRLIVGLGIGALFIGALVTGLSLGIVSALTSGGSLAEAVQVVWAMTLVAATVGMMFPGVLILPFTLVAAAVWAVLMVAIQAWVSPDGD
jgi:hypothetical protein